MSQAGLRAAPSAGEFNQQAGAWAGEQLLGEATLPHRGGHRQTTSARCGLIDRLQAVSRTPEDVSVIGYDNTFIAALSHVALTTVNQPRREMGREAFELCAGAPRAAPSARSRSCPRARRAIHDRPLLASVLRPWRSMGPYKAATAEHHERLERRVDIAARLRSRDAYRRLLERFYGSTNRSRSGCGPYERDVPAAPEGPAARARHRGAGRRPAHAAGREPAAADAHRRGGTRRPLRARGRDARRRSDRPHGARPGTCRALVLRRLRLRSLARVQDVRGRATARTARRPSRPSRHGSLGLRMNEPLLAPGTPVNLDNCHREPIRTPGGVQAHGALLAADAQTLEIVQISANAPAILGRELLGATLGDVLGADAVDELAQRSTEPTPNLRPARIAVGNAFAYRSGGVLVVEIEPVPTAAPSLTAYQDEIARSVTILQRRPVDRGAAVARGAGGQGPGGLRPRVGLPLRARRPRRDRRRGAKRRTCPRSSGCTIPPPTSRPRRARCSCRTGIRFIQDVNADAAPLEPLVNPVTGEWLDLSEGVLRAVSPIHIQYLKNMGATASMSIALFVESRLWGLISAPPLQRRAARPARGARDVRADRDRRLDAAAGARAARGVPGARRSSAPSARRCSTGLPRRRASSTGSTTRPCSAVCNAQGAVVCIDGERAADRADPGDDRAARRRRDHAHGRRRRRDAGRAARAARPRARELHRLVPARVRPHRHVGAPAEVPRRTRPAHPGGLVRHLGRVGRGDVEAVGSGRGRVRERAAQRARDVPDHPRGAARGAERRARPLQRGARRVRLRRRARPQGAAARDRELHELPGRGLRRRARARRPANGWRRSCGSRSGWRRCWTRCSSTRGSAAPTSTSPSSRSARWSRRRSTCSPARPTWPSAAGSSRCAATGSACASCS